MTRYNDFRINDIIIMQKTMVLWDNAHYTQNENYALLVGALKKEGETLEPWLLLARLKTRGRKQKLNMYQSSWF